MYNNFLGINLYLNSLYLVFIIIRKIFIYSFLKKIAGTDNTGRSVSSVRLGQEFDVDVDAIAATMQGHSKGNYNFDYNILSIFP